MDQFTDFLKGLLRTKLAGGLVGKVCMAVMVVCVTMIVAAAALRDPYLLGGAIIIAFLFGFPLLWKIIDFAEKNADAAILESPEYAKLMTARERAKGRSEVQVRVTDVVEERPAILAPGVDPNIPDIEVISIPPPKASGVQ